MALRLASNHRTGPSDRASRTDAFAPNWSERIVTVVATTLAVMLVAAVAVLMGSV